MSTESESRDTRDKVIKALTLLDQASLDQVRIDRKLEVHVREHLEKIQGLERSILMLDGKADTLIAKVDGIEASIYETAQAAVQTAVLSAITDVNISKRVTDAIEVEKRNASWSFSKWILAGILAALIAIADVGFHLVVGWVDGALKNPTGPSSSSSSATRITT